VAGALISVAEKSRGPVLLRAASARGSVEPIMASRRTSLLRIVVVGGG